MPDEPRYGAVGARYKDTRKKVVTINDVKSTDIDTLDEVAININSLRYQVTGEESPIDFNDFNKIISGDGWYILIKKDGSIDSGLLKKDEDSSKEYNSYLSRFNVSRIDARATEEPFVKKLTPTNGKRRYEMKDNVIF